MANVKCDFNFVSSKLISSALQLQSITSLFLFTLTYKALMKYTATKTTDKYV